jgi:hypothetical protein
LTAVHPNFGPREYPDLDHWSGGVHAVVPKSPVPVEDLLTLDLADESRIGWLLSFDPQRFIPGGVERDGLLAAVRDAAGRNVAWGERLTNALAKREAWASDLWPSVIGGWQRAEPVGEDLTRLLALIEGYSPIDSSAGDAVVALLEASVERHKDVLSEEQLSAIERLLDRLFRTGDTPSGVGTERRTEWLLKAINQRGGHVARVWLMVLSRRRKDAGRDWNGLPEAYKTRFRDVVVGTNPNAQYSRIVLAAALHFLYAIDSQWATEKFIPLFDADESEMRAEQLLHGFLGGSGWSDALFAQLRPYLEKVFTRLDDQLSEIREKMAEFLAAVAASSLIDPWHGGWLLSFIRDAGLAARKEWAAHFGRIVENLPPEATSQVWTTWVREYWEQRLNGVPAPLTTDEVQGMLSWCFGFTMSFAEVADLIVRTPAPAVPDHLFFFRLREPETRLNEMNASAVARVVRHLLSGAQSVQWSCEDMDRVVRALKPLGARAEDLRQVCEDMARLGCPTARALRAYVDQNEARG